MPPWRSPGAPEWDRWRGLATDSTDSWQPEWVEECVNPPTRVQVASDFSDRLVDAFRG